ncbi:phosphonates import ATP-binding protein PhnC 1 [Robertmurraya siralis]|uniref:Phosphonates import ATP-binding protein PhnC 1 n=1 Tax=Robertmurraya siralis TaxID=77777 RepID=A0A919WLS5_9BACI|nr:ATP-binding cassette domain-containing protein [Robertmurraya siralis]PAE18234.1 ABC transporter ATP-binding protein [Bacillus sp. 7504-2]GIN64453.1 phosphonates import ATP-binding protein PhnC 1 [Robertmurraya siralis]
MASSNIIEAKNLKIQFQGKIALSSLSFSIKKGEKVALIGPSGAGKTTLLNTLATIIKPDEGELWIDQLSFKEMQNRKMLAKKLGMIRQQFDLVDQLPVIHNVLAGKLSDWSLFKSLLSLIYPQEKILAMNALERVGLGDKWSEKTSNLSGGEQQRVALARLLVQKPEIILADEPVASLDPARAEDVLAILTKLVHEEKQTLITSLHSVEYAKKYFTRIIALRDGMIYFDLPAHEVSAKDLASLYVLKEKV